MSDFEARVKAVLDDSELKKLDELEKREITIKTNLGDASDDINRVNQQLKTTQRSANSFGSTLKNVLNFGGVFSVTSKAIQAIEKAMSGAIEATKNWDSSITNLRMATGGSYEEVNQLVKGYNELGKTLGATTAEVSTAADSWLRQGHSIADTNTLIRNSMILSKVAGIESANATQYLTSAMKGYSVAANDTIGIVDKLTAVDLVSATDAGGLAEAMSRTAETADMAGISMDKLLGYLAITGEVTQKSMSSIGEGFKTIFTRMSDIKAGKLELIDEDGMSESLSDVETVLSGVGIKLRDSNNEFRNFGDVLDEVGAAWSSYSSVQQAAISKAFAGTRQSENFKVLMENYSAATSYMETAMNSSGTAEKKFDAYLDSIEAKTKSLQASFESLATNTVSTEMFGGIIDATNSVVTFLDKTNLLKSSLAGIAGASTIKVFTTLASGIANAAVQMNDFNTALNLLKTGDIGENQMQQLVQLTANLSKSQTKAIVSSSALSTQQRMTILTAQGMSTAEAQAALSTMGLATAENAATASTFSLKGALQGLWATLLANPFVLVAAGITGVVAAFSNLSQAAEESSQIAADNLTKLQERAQTTSENRTSLKSLIAQYKELAEASNGVWSSEQMSELKSIQNSISDLVGDQASSLDLVNGKLDEEYQKLLSIYSTMSQNEYADTESAYLASLQEFEKGYHRETDFWGNSKEDDFQAGWYIRRAYEELNDVSADVAEKWWASQAGFEDTQWLGDIPAALDAIGSYEEGLEKLYEWRQLLIDATNEGFGDSLGNAYDTADALSYVNSKISEFEGIIQDADDAKNAFFSAKANNEALDYLVNNNIDSQKAFTDYINSVLTNGDISKDYGKALVTAMQSYLPQFTIPDNVKKSFIVERDKLLTELSEEIPDADNDFLGNWLDSLDVSKYQSFADWWKDYSGSDAVTSSQESMLSSFEAHLERISIAANGVTNDIESIALPDIETETSGIEAVTSAIKEASSAIGLTSGSIDTLTERYKNLDSFNADALFENTATGVRLNSNYLAALEQEYEGIQKLKISEDLAAANEQYDNLSEAIKNCSDNDLKKDLEAQQKETQKTIASLEKLQAEYDGLTSAYAEWVNAMNSEQSGSQYDAIVDAKDDMKKAYQNGEYGNTALQEYLELMTGADITGAENFQQRIERMDGAYAQLSQRIEGTSYSLNDFLNGGQNGCNAFLKATEQLGNGWATFNKETNSWDLNFDDQELANELGTSVEFVQSMMDKLRLYGFDIDTGDASESIQSIKDKMADLQDYMNSLELEPKIKTPEEAIGKIKETANEIKNNTELDTETSESSLKALCDYAEQLYSQVNQPSFMDINTDDVQDGYEDITEALQKYQKAKNKADAAEAVFGEDSNQAKEARKEVDKYADSIADMDTDKLEDVGIEISAEEDAGQTIAQQIEGQIPEVNIPVTTAAESAETAESGSTTGTIDYGVGNITLPEGVVGEGIIDYAVGNVAKPTGVVATGVINYTLGSVATPSGGGVGVNGTAHASGTAYASGNWGAKSSGESLMGELGREIMVNPATGTWRTVGDYGAEFVDVPKGAIIFNHKQTESLLKNGYVTGRGKALAGGTAFANGTAYAAGPGLDGSSSGGSGSSSSSKSTEDESDDMPDKMDWIEVLIDRIERAIDRVAKIAESAFKNFETRSSAMFDQVDRVNEEIKIQEQAYERYMQEAASVSLQPGTIDRIQNGTLEITQFSEENQKAIDEYREWYEKAIDAQEAIEDLHEKVAEIYVEHFETIQENFENQLDILEHSTTSLENSIDVAEANGRLGSTEYYKAMLDIERQNISTLEKERGELQKAFDDAMTSGEIEEGSDAWYEMKAGINEVDEAIDEANISIAECAKSIREIEWENFDYLIDKIDQLANESDFLISLMESSELHGENGQLTDTGMATVGLRAMNYNVYMSNADSYAEELKRLDAAIAEDPYNTDLIERREEVLELQQDSILAAEEEKEAIKDLVEEGIDLELESLQELIDDYSDALDSAKDLYNYQNKIDDHVSEISTLRKQLLSYEGDDSEETRAVVQKLKLDLEEAEKNLEETEYEQYINDQKKILDDMYTEYEDILNERLDNIDTLMEDMIDSVNASAESISRTISDEAANVGYALTGNMQSVWSNATEGNNVVSIYDDGFSEKLTTTNTTLSNIEKYVAEMVEDANASAMGIVAGTSAEIPEVEDIYVPIERVVPVTPYVPETSESVSAVNVGGYYEESSTKSKVKTNQEDKTEGTSSVPSGYSIAQYQKLTLDEKKYYGLKGYSSGGLVDFTGIAQLHGSDQKPELVLNANDTANFIELKDVLRDLANQDITLGQASNFNVESVAHDVIDTSMIMSAIRSQGYGEMSNNFGDINISIPIEHVNDYNDFVNQLRSDKKFEKMIQSMTVDQLTGKSSLAKNTCRW